ncbi:MAG: TspO/MBR family protein [Alphaproteobacteria bacterium]
MKSVLMFVLAIIISFIPGAIGVMFTPHNQNDLWYNALNNSVLTPDGWVFGVAWPVLYLLLGIALFLIMSRNTTFSKAKSYWLFFIQMVLNAGWTFVFFGLQMPNTAMLILCALVLVSVWMARAFYSISKSASILTWPYVLWLLFALYMNGFIVMMN